MHEAMASGERIPGSQNVDAIYVRNRKKQSVRDAQLDASIAVARALEREAKDQHPNPQAMLALATAMRTGAEIEAANEWIDEQLAMAADQRKKMLVRGTEGRELPEHEPGPEKEAEP